MTAYRYRAKRGPREIAEGIVEAATEKEAIEKLGRQGLVPVRLDVDSAPASNVSVPRSSLKGAAGGRVRHRDMTAFTRQLASLLRSGVPILSALNLISEQSEHANMKAIFSDIHEEIKNGATFSATLERYPKAFSPLYIAMVRAGEDSGGLPEALLRVAEYRAKQEEMRSRIRMASAYPILMALVGIGTIVFMLTFVLPRLMGLFSGMGQSLPMPTKILIGISTFLQVRWPWILLGTGLGAALLMQQSKTKAFRSLVGSIILRLPLIGNLALKAELSRFCRTLELLIKSGISIFRAIDVAIPVIDNEIIKNQLRQGYRDLEQGGSFGKSLKSAKIFPAFVTTILIVGEQSGKLDEALSEVATAYEHDTDEAMKMTANLLEPLMILVMGLIVGFIVIAMLLPIFEINLMAR